MRAILYTIVFTFSVVSFSQQTHEVSLVSRMDGEKTLVNGQEVEFWGYGIDNPNIVNDKISLPGPILRFDLGDTVIINLTNVSPEDHTIHWHGLDVDQANDGVPNTSGGGVGGNGGQFTYTFVCKEPGTYLYHCHVLTTLHLAMGMYGFFIIDPTDALQLYSNSGKYTKEFNYLFSEMDISWNLNPTSPGNFYLYDPNYAMVNGWASNEIEAENQLITATTADSIGLRLANIGYGHYEVILPPELNAVVYGSDGREVNHFAADTIHLYPGERFGLVGYPTTELMDSITVNFYDLRNENNFYTNYIPVTITDVADVAIHDRTPLVIYPNPFESIITVDDVPLAGPAKIVGLNGKEVWSGSLKKGTNKIEINAERGVYLLSFGDLTYKLMKY